LLQIKIPYFLTLFYEKEKNEIKSLFTKYYEDKSDLVKAEAKYQLALIMFYDSNILTNKEEYLGTIYQAHQIFESIYHYEDNRFDAKLLDAICSYIGYSFLQNIEMADLDHNKIHDLLWEVMLLQLDESANSVYFNIGNNISRIHSIIKTNPENRLDYRGGFSKLCYL